MGNKLPSTRREMRRAGYEFTGLGKCKSCTASIEWWVTTNGSSVPFNPGGEDDKATVHFATCPNADEHRKGAKAAAKPVPHAVQPEPMAGTPAARTVFERELKVLMERSGARCAVLLYDDGESLAYRLIQDPEDLRMCLISAANHARDAVRRDRAQLQGGNR